MEDDLSANLSLNILPDELVPTKEVRKQKIHGDRRSRVKQRKAAWTEKQKNVHNLNPKATKRKHEEDSHQNSEDATHKKDAPALPNKDGVKKAKSSVVISSLFRKNPEVPVISSSEVEALQENVFTGDTFKDLPLHPYLIANLEEKQGFKQMTEVQRRTIPPLLRNKDALVKSQTGSGKTLAYAVPIVQSLQSRMVKVRRDDGPYALIIVPTRELVLQSHDLFQKLLRSFVWIVPGCLMGGEKRKAEKSRLRKGINVLVATPGRLMDHINTTGVLSLARVRWLVIDEADRLLELGYERDIAQILNALKSQCPDPPQTVLLSATLSQGVERLSSITLNQPERINVSEDPVSDCSKTQRTNGKSKSSVEQPKESGLTEKPPTYGEEEALGAGRFSLPSQLKQHFVVTPCKLRLVTLSALILWKCKYSKPCSKMIVFLSTQDSVEYHARLLSQVLGCKRSIEKKLSRLASGVKSEEEEEEDIGSTGDEEDRGKSKDRAKAKQGLQVFKLHGDMAQKERSQTFQEFTTTTSGVLFCTDVAARGLDLPHVDWIVQYTSPGATVDYIHRVGRTARAGSVGHALLFLMPSEAGYVEELNRHGISLKQFDQTAILKCLLENISDLPKPTSNTSGLETPHTQEEAATYLQDRFEECILDRKDMHALAAKGFQSYVRGYATYSKEVKDIFKVGDLHLGHVAKSFGLREAPTNIHGITAKHQAPATGGGNKYKKKKEEKPSKRPLSFKQATLSEYSSGLQKSQARKVMAKPGGKMKAKARKLSKGSKFVKKR